jgi:hypothetical protein
MSMRLKRYENNESMMRMLLCLVEHCPSIEVFRRQQHAMKVDRFHSEYHFLLAIDLINR